MATIGTLGLYMTFSSTIEALAPVLVWSLLIVVLRSVVSWPLLFLSAVFLQVSFESTPIALNLILGPRATFDCPMSSSSTILALRLFLPWSLNRLWCRRLVLFLEGLKKCFDDIGLVGAWFFSVV